MSIVKTNYIEDLKLNVLGAGDKFAAAFIDNMIKTKKHNIYKSVEHSSNYTTHLLQKGK